MELGVSSKLFHLWKLTQGLTSRGRSIEVYFNVNTPIYIVRLAGIRCNNHVRVLEYLHLAGVKHALVVWHVERTFVLHG